MRLLKLALLAELELGLVWTLLLISTPQVDLAAVLLFLWLYPLHLVCMIAGVAAFWRWPATRPLAAAVLVMPIVLLFVPAVVRTMAGGPVVVHPAAWLGLAGIPLGACLLLPHQVADFLPAWTLRSRWLNVSTVVLLSLMIALWACALLAAAGFASRAGELVDARSRPIDPELGKMVLVAIAFAALSAFIAGITFLTSYVGLFQRVDRSQHKLRVAQLVLSLVVLVPTVPALAIGLFLAAIQMTSPG